MAQQQVTELPRFVSALLSQLEQRFPSVTTEVERLRAAGTDHYRIGLVSQAFDGIPMMKRQEIVWDIAGATVDRDEFLKLSMIVTMTPEELTGDE